MKFRKFGKTVLFAALGSTVVFSLSSCIRSFTSGYLYVTGTVTSTPSGNGIISGYKIDNNTGNLVPMHGLPVSSGGSNPVRAVLLSGGRFVYVLNRGANKEGGSDCTTADPCLNSNITQFVVGGNGILTPQETFYTQGINPFRLLQDGSGAYLFALDHDAPSNQYCGVAIVGATSCGDITIFNVNATTGRLSLVTNAQLTSSAGSQVPYFPVPANPIDFAFTTSYVLTLAGTPGASTTTPPATAQTVFPYAYNSTNGELSSTGQGVPQQITNGSNEPMGQGTAIVYASGKAFILDNEPLTATLNGTSTTSPSQVLTYTVANGSLQALTGGAVQDDPTEANPIYLIIENKGKYLYVANQEGADSTEGSGIAGFVIDPSSSQLSLIAGEPFSTGAAPQCLIEDPSNQYIYTANASDSTVTGRLLDPNSGVLNNVHGWTGKVTLTGPATWCFVSGRTN
jgi:6-phosphogluconolactonase (cycloisomerase 2 family)